MPQRKTASARGLKLDGAPSPSSSIKSRYVGGTAATPKTPDWVVGVARADEPRTVRGTHRAKDWDTLHRKCAAAVSDEPSTTKARVFSTRDRAPSVRGEAYHFGLCTLHLRCLPPMFVSERALTQVLTEMLEFNGKVGSVLQVTVERRLDDEKFRSWGLVTLSNVTSAKKILATYSKVSMNIEFEVHALNIIQASKSGGSFKKIYEESKRKAAEAANQLIGEKQKAKDLRRRGLGNATGAHLYSYNTCTLHVRNIPSMKSLHAGSIVEYEAAVAKLFQDRLDMGTLPKGRVVQVTIRHREYTTCKKTGKEIPAMSWGLVTLDSEGAVAAVQQEGPSEEPSEVSSSLAGLELNSIDVKTANVSIGEFGRIYQEGQRRAANYFANLNGTRQTLLVNRAQRQRHLSMTASKDLDIALTVGQQLGTKKLESTKRESSSRQSSNKTRRSGTASARSDTGSSDSDSFMHYHTNPNLYHRAHGTDRAYQAWLSPRMPSIKRPGRDLPDHWPTSPVSRERTQTRLMRISRMSLSGCSTADRQREVMRERRVERKRAEDIAGYRAAFRLIDDDRSGQIDPMEIVTFAEKMGKTVDTAKFWKLFNSLDHDNSADLDEDEFVKLLDGLTERVMYGAPEPNADLSSKQTSRMMVISTDSLQDDDIRQPSAAKQAVELDDNSSQVMPAQPGTEILNDMIEHKRQVADIFNAIRTLRTGMVLQGISPPHLRMLAPQDLGASNRGDSAPVPDLKNMGAMTRFLDLFSVGSPTMSGKSASKDKAPTPSKLKGKLHGKSALASMTPNPPAKAMTPGLKVGTQLLKGRSKSALVEDDAEKLNA